MITTCNREYEIIFRDPFGNLQFYLQGEYMVRWALKEGIPGVITMELPTRLCNIGEFVISDFNEDFRIEVRRKVDGVRTLVGEAPFFLHQMSAKQNENGERVISIEGEGSLGLIDRHIMPYDADDPRSDLAALACDDQMKFVVRNNFLGIAGSYIIDPDPLRDLSTYIQVEADATAITAQYQGKSQNQSVLSVLDRIQKYAFSQGEPLFYHLVQISDFANPFLEFRTYPTQRGVDRTLTTGGANARAIMPDNGTVSEYELTYNWKQTASRMYGGGKGTGGGRGYVVSDDPDLPNRLLGSPFALREMFANVGSDDNVDVQVETDTQLQNNIASIQLSGSMGETPVFIYGRDWVWGDRITANIEGVALDVFVETEECTLEDGRENLTVGFSNNLQRRLSGMGGILQRVNRVERRVDYLNAVDYAP